jgi:hypothetical protein
MKVYVVMGNDYPDAVFKDERKADEYVEMKKKYYSDHSRRPIHWRHYEFELRE